MSDTHDSTGNDEHIGAPRVPAGSRNESRDAQRNLAAGYDATPDGRGGEAKNDVSPPRVSLAEQIEEVAREIRQRERLYPKWIADKRYKPETAAQKLNDMRAAHETLQFIERHREGLRLMIAVLQRVEKFGSASTVGIITDDEAQILLEQPAVQAVLAAFPDAIITDVRSIERPQT